MAQADRTFWRHLTKGHEARQGTKSLFFGSPALTFCPKGADTIPNLYPFRSSALFP